MKILQNKKLLLCCVGCIFCFSSCTNDFFKSDNLFSSNTVLHKTDELEEESNPEDNVVVFVDKKTEAVVSFRLWDNSFDPNKLDIQYIVDIPYPLHNRDTSVSLRLLDDMGFMLKEYHISSVEGGFTGSLKGWGAVSRCLAQHVRGVELAIS